MLSALLYNMGGVYPSLSVGKMVPFDVVSPKDAQIVNTVATEALKLQRERSVPDVLVVSLSKFVSVQESINLFLSNLESTKDLSESQRTTKLKDLAPFLTLRDITSLMKVDPKELEGDLNKVFAVLPREERLDVLSNEVAGIINSLNLDPGTSQAFMNLILGYFRINATVDNSLTNELKQKAIQDIVPVVVDVKKGQILVRSGEILTPEKAYVLKELGIMDNLSGIRSFVSLFFFSGLLLLAFRFIIANFSPKIVLDRGHMIVLGVLSSVYILFVFVLFPISPIIVPLASVSLLLSLIFTPAISLLYSVMLAILVFFFGNFSLLGFYIAIISAFAGAFFGRGIQRRGDLSDTAFLFSLTFFLAVLLWDIWSGINVLDSLGQFAFAIANGFLSSIAAMGALPYIESTVGVLSPLKLIDLSNPSHPLLKRLQIEAPGTYHHSVIVANLAETAAEEINADPLLARVASYYHDVGKLKRPQFFVENQKNGVNLHSEISPWLSATILISHVKDGVEIGKSYGIPEKILDIVSQHHGTSLIVFFYHKALQSGFSEVEEKDFRYPGPLPKTKEAAIVMLADAVEAAVRASSGSVSPKIDSLIDRIFKNKLEDGQLSESPMTLQELLRIKEVFIRLFMGSFHQRIEYPDLVELNKK
jgi:putative nucleotidyltransferase with HDIG domain